jgi:hypothetical protein
MIYILGLTKITKYDILLFLCSTKYMIFRVYFFMLVECIIFCTQTFSPLSTKGSSLSGLGQSGSTGHTLQPALSTAISPSPARGHSRQRRLGHRCRHARDHHLEGDA